MVSRILRFIAAGGLSFLAFGQHSLNEEPAAALHSIDTPEARAPLVQLLNRARNAYEVRTAGLAYNLKVTFTVDSGGQTSYDGTWQMEDVFDPQLGLRWTATLPGAYSITRISSRGALYGEESDSYVPLRLHEARAALFHALPGANYVNRASIRTAGVEWNGQQLTCVYVSGAGGGTNPIRRWNETEECIDPGSGLLRLHSQVPGRYYEYDYSNPVQFGRESLPRTVTVHEAGRIVTSITIESMTELTASDPSLFVPTAEMRANGRPIQLGAAETLFRLSPASPAGAAAGPVCVYGLVTASGDLVEAHSLQPSNPNSPAAIDAARKMSFSRPAAPGAAPQQYPVFVVWRFVPSR